MAPTAGALLFCTLLLFALHALVNAVGLLHDDLQLLLATASYLVGMLVLAVRRGEGRLGADRP